ncbi:MAG: hypothetical protein IPM76_05515 [Chloroflexi bacterium]|nr:hypothetical protein [Chloroflexota bacterium]
MRDDFFHGIIHELRTPLATILMYARLLREGKAPEKEKADRFLGVIERERPAAKNGAPDAASSQAGSARIAAQPGTGRTEPLI